MKIWNKLGIFRMASAFGRLSGLVLACAGLVLALGSAGATAQSENATPISVELNKLEAIDNGCRIYLVVNNQTEARIDTLKLDLVLFKTDGIVDQRWFLDLAPLRKQKRIVKLFELGNVKCEELGSFLVNDVVECRSGSDAIENCLAKLDLSSRASAKFSK